MLLYIGRFYVILHTKIFFFSPMIVSSIRGFYVVVRKYIMLYIERLRSLAIRAPFYSTFDLFFPYIITYKM